jgi:hypothetical protein
MTTLGRFAIAAASILLPALGGCGANGGTNTTSHGVDSGQELEPAVGDGAARDAVALQLDSGSPADVGIDPGDAHSPAGSPDGPGPGDGAVVADAANQTVDGPPGTPAGPNAFTCTLVIGIQATGQWFDAGFEKLVDDSKWELIAVHSGFIQDWADPNGPMWSMSPSSPCASNPKAPDRVIFVGLYLHWMDATVDQWVSQLAAVVTNLKAKNSNLRRVELATFVRAPGDMPCPGTMPFKSWIKPAQDQANVTVAAMFPDLVTVSPKFEVSSCADFGGNPPHFTSAAAMAVAKMIADNYNH